MKYRLPDGTLIKVYVCVGADCTVSASVCYCVRIWYTSYVCVKAALELCVCVCVKNIGVSVWAKVVLCVCWTQQVPRDHSAAATVRVGRFSLLSGKLVGVRERRKVTSSVHETAEVRRFLWISLTSCSSFFVFIFFLNTGTVVGSR